MNRAPDSTDVTTYLVLRLAATNVEATGLDVTTFDLQYVRSRALPSAKQDATALVAANSDHADYKAIEVDPTDQPGLYRVDWPDAAFVAGVPEVVLTVKCATCFTEHLSMTLDTPGSAILTAIGVIGNRIGLFTGSGVNTILGFLKALFRKDLPAPSDVGGTFDPATDSAEAIREKTDTLTPGAAKNVTISGKEITIT